MSVVRAGVGRNKFEQDQLDTFIIETDNVGEIIAVRRGPSDGFRGALVMRRYVVDDSMPHDDGDWAVLPEAMFGSTNCVRITTQLSSHTTI